MHLLEINKENYIGQADPFIFEANGKFYIYTTGSDGIYAYFADDLFGKWNFYGRVFTYEGKGVHDFWAPSVIESMALIIFTARLNFLTTSLTKAVTIRLCTFHHQKVRLVLLKTQNSFCTHFQSTRTLLKMKTACLFFIQPTPLRVKDLVHILFATAF